jgi:peptidoglycan-associated lipoprotein
MQKQWMIMLAAVLTTGCSPDSLVRQNSDAFEQSSSAQLVARQRAEAAARQARMLKDQEALKRQLDERKRREAAAGPHGPEIHPVGQNSIDGNPLRDPAAALRPLEEMSVQASIYYDYDAYVVKPEYQQVLEQHAARLLMEPALKLSVEGNCDERGSREYNLALGQRRSDAVKRVLVLLGVPAGQINAVSLGSEKPVSQGGSEDDLAKNRRSDIVYPGAQTVK